MSIAEGPVRFRRWLKSKHPSEVVGHPMSGCDCPIARFLRRRLGESVGIDGITFRLMRQRFNNRRQLPAWARRFIAEIDKRKHPIQARTALKVLEEIS